MYIFSVYLSLFLLTVAFAQGVVIDDSFYSQSLGEMRNVNVYLPEGYDDGGYFPVIYFLHGLGADNDDYGEFAVIMDQLVAFGVVSPTIIVKPDGSIPPWGGSMYHNSELYGLFEDYIVFDLVEYIDASYRTLPEPGKRTLMGHSMGGHGAMKLAFRHPERFAGVASLAGFVSLTPFDFWFEQIMEENGGSGPYDPNAGFFTYALYTAAGAFSPHIPNPPYNVDLPLDNNGNILSDVFDEWQSNMPTVLASQNPAVHDLAIYFGCGDEDELGFYPMNLVLVDTLTHLNIEHRFDTYDGDHTSHLYLCGPIALVFLDSVMTHTASMGRVQAAIPQQARLDQNYPNPFNSSTRITYVLSHSCRATLTVYDIMGRMVETLTEEFHPAGTHTITLSGDEWSSGVYFIRLHAEGFRQTRKMVLLK